MANDVLLPILARWQEAKNLLCCRKESFWSISTVPCDGTPKPRRFCKQGCDGLSLAAQ